MLAFQGLSRWVPADAGGARWLYRDLSSRCAAGSFTAVVGPNGAGKTTLLRDAVGLQTPLSGSVVLDGRELSQWSRRARAQTMAYLPQRPPIPDGLTVRELATLGRTPHQGWWSSAGRPDQDAVARSLHMTDLDTLAHRSVTSLSGGELQRAMMARMLATEAPLLVLDEPTTSLDVRHALYVVELLAALARAGRTVLVALHELDLAARHADAVILLYGDGRWATGPTEQVLTAVAVEQAFGVEARGPRAMDVALPAPLRRRIEQAVDGGHVDVGRDGIGEPIDLGVEVGHRR